MKALPFLLLCVALIARADDPLAILRKSAKEAARLYPDAAVEGSPFYNRMVEIEKRLIAANDPLVNDPNKPLIIAMRADAELKTAPPSVNQAEQDAVAATYKSAEEAKRLYPAMNDPNSALFLKALEIERRLTAANDPLINDPNKPLVLTMRADEELKEAKQVETKQHLQDFTWFDAAVSKYPQLGISGSVFARAYAALEREYAGTAASREPSHPMFLADSVAKQMETLREPQPANPPSRANTFGTPQGIIAAGGRAQLFTPRDDTQDKLDAIQRQLDMQAEQQKLDAFRQHQLETAEKFRRMAR